MSISIFMFFSISEEKKENFPNHFNYKDIVINTDLGWQSKTIENKFIIYKGYADNFDLSENLKEIINFEKPHFTGNFCILCFFKDSLIMLNDIYRSFPIFYNNNEITNLYELEYKVYSDEILFSDLNFKIYKKKHDPIGKIETNVLTEDEVIDQISEYNNKKISNFLKFNNLPVVSFLSGGIDTMLVYSYILKYCNIKLLAGEYFEFDYFFLKNHGYIKKNWSYKQLHHFLKPTLFTSGTSGDSYMLRSPTISNLYMISQGTNILTKLNTEQYKECTNAEYFSSEKNINLFNQQEIYYKQKIKAKAPKKLINKFLCNITLNDYQHHHLGNTLTFTPLRDLNVTKLLLQLPFENLQDQIMNNTISKKLIEKNNPILLNYWV